LAKWTIANVFSGPLWIAFLIVLEKPPFELKIDGISTEPDTWKGLQSLQNQLISVGWPGIGFTSSAALVKEVFQSGALELRGMSCRSFQKRHPLQLHYISSRLYMPTRLRIFWCAN
jgi:hypothetical protein